MPLPTVTLDDRRFQDIVDQAKTLIPHYCPEWTDHNVSDPGVALIELFAWMTDLMLYRESDTRQDVREVPELIGSGSSRPARRAPGHLLYLSAAQPSEVVIGENTEVATGRTESNPAILFSPETDLAIRTPLLVGAFTRDVEHRGEGEWSEHDLTQIDLPGARVQVFAGRPTPGDAFYLAFKHDLSHHLLALLVDCEQAGGAGVDPTQPPIQWEVWQGGSVRWAPCEVEKDGTGGFNWSGEILLHLPAMSRVSFREVPAYWLRCRLLEPRSGATTYEVSPELERLRLECRGGTVMARHAVTVLNEVVGRSTGVPGESYRLLQTPVLARDATRDYLMVEPPGATAQRWTEVADFGDSGPEDRHYTLDSVDGVLTLGPALLQPDGTMYRFGEVPPKGSLLRFTRYQHGGGVVGNVPRGMLTVLKSSIPYVARVVNRQPAVGGRDAQSLEDAKVRAPQTLRTRTRAVTADEFETLARHVPGVDRARCLAPGSQPGPAGAPRPGEVIMAVLPQVDDAQGYIPPERLTLSADLKQGVEKYLDERRLIGTRLEVRSPQFIWVSIEAKIRLADRADPALVVETRKRAELELYRYLNPYVGGPGGTGWPFGRDLHVSELYALLQRVAGIEFVDELHIAVRDPGSGSPPQQAPPRLAIPPYGLICSDVHRVTRS
jgi:predicted phage baseplate assembly protein